MYTFTTYQKAYNIYLYLEKNRNKYKFAPKAFLIAPRVGVTELEQKLKGQFLKKDLYSEQIFALPYSRTEPLKTFLSYFQKIQNKYQSAPKPNVTPKLALAKMITRTYS